LGLDLGGIGVRIAIFDQDVAADRPSEFPEPLAEILKITLCVRIVLGVPQQYRDPPHPGHRLLRARREGAHDRRAADQRDEIAPPHHSITSSARARNASGIVTPIAFALLRFITSSNFVGCSTGM